MTQLYKHKQYLLFMNGVILWIIWKKFDSQRNEFHFTQQMDNDNVDVETMNNSVAAWH